MSNRAERRHRSRQAKARKATAMDRKATRRAKAEVRQPKPRPAGRAQESVARLLLELVESDLPALEAAKAFRDAAEEALREVMLNRWTSPAFAFGDLAICHRFSVADDRWQEVFHSREGLLRQFAAEARTDLDPEVTRVVARVEVLLGLDS